MQTWVAQAEMLAESSQRDKARRPPTVGKFVAFRVPVRRWSLRVDFIYVKLLILLFLICTFFLLCETR